MAKISLFSALPVVGQDEDIRWYGVAICAQRVLYEKLIYEYVGTNMCAHRSSTEYGHTHTMEGTEQV